MKYQATWMVQRQKLPLEDIFFINYETMEIIY